MSVVLRALQRGDAPILAAHANNPQIAKYMRDRFPNPYTVDDALRFIDFVTSDQSRERAFGIRTKVHGDVVGVISLSLQSDTQRHAAELGYWVGEAEWGKGVASAAVAELLDNLKMYVDTPLRRIYSYVYADNIASSCVLTKNGFQNEGYLRDYAIKHDEFKDAILYSRIIRETVN
jgi:ribosomal-protein-alanine N-acetyltransferase